MTTCRLEIQRRAGIDARKVQPNGFTGIAQGKCPGCGVSPFHVQGSNVRPDPNRPHDGKMANGRCVACGDPVGYLYVVVDTLFGIEEDERMLNGRARVY